MFADVCAPYKERDKTPEAGCVIDKSDNCIKVMSLESLCVGSADNKSKDQTEEETWSYEKVSGSLQRLILLL